MGRALLLIMCLALAGCGYMDKLTGGRDDTVLPGPREDAIPGKKQFPEPDAAPPPPPCKAGDPNCLPPPEGDGTFSDPQ
jgi:hypothetical protein